MSSTNSTTATKVLNHKVTIKRKSNSLKTKRPLQCLETLTERAGIRSEETLEGVKNLLYFENQNNSRIPAEIKKLKLEHINNNQGEDKVKKQQDKDNLTASQV